MGKILITTTDFSEEYDNIKELEKIIIFAKENENISISLFKKILDDFQNVDVETYKTKEELLFLVGMLVGRNYSEDTEFIISSCLISLSKTITDKFQISTGTEKLSINLGSEKKRNHFLVNSLDDDQLNFAKRLHKIRINATTIAKVVKNNVNKLKRGKFKEEDAWNLLKKISYLNSRMQAVLEYSAMAKFNTKEEFIEDNLFDFIEEYCENILAQDEDIEVEVLRKDEKGVNIRFIPQDIAVILDNVISNSIKYNATLLKIVLNKDGNSYTIDFIDNGDGLDPSIEDVRELFEFGKGYTFTGTGVGLYHIKSIVEEELKGTVDINLEETKGFALRVRFEKI